MKKYKVSLEINIKEWVLIPYYVSYKVHGGDDRDTYNFKTCQFLCFDLRMMNFINR
jgi:hypothetical protein